VTAMLDNNAAIGRYLAGRIPRIQRASLSAGMELKHLIGMNGHA